MTVTDANNDQTRVRSARRRRAGWVLWWRSGSWARSYLRSGIFRNSGGCRPILGTS